MHGNTSADGEAAPAGEDQGLNEASDAKEGQGSVPDAQKSEETIVLPDVPTTAPSMPGQPDSKRRKVDTDDTEASPQDET